MRIEVDREYVGKITVTGTAQIFGLAFRPGSSTWVVYADMVGPGSAVESVWARFLNPRKEAVLERVGKPDYKLGYSPHLIRYQTKLQSIGQDNLICVIDDEDDVAYSYCLMKGGKPHPASLLQHVKAVCRAPLFPEWAESGELMQVGMLAKLLIPCSKIGSAELLAVRKSDEEWESAISSARSSGLLKFPR